MGTRAAVYARISSDTEGQAAGVARQQHDATQLAEERGWTVVADLVDNDLSASRYATKVRPAFKQLLSLIETGQIDAVVVWHIDRLYRQPKELEGLIDLVEKHRVTIATCSGDIDLETGDGMLTARILGAMSAKESDDKSRRIKRKHQEIAARGGYSGGKRPFGYERDGVTIRESEADLIRDAARRVLAGETIGSICRMWTDQGIPTATGNNIWLRGTIKRLLLTPRLAGLRTHKGALTPAVWPAIIDEPTHRRLVAILTDPNRNKVGGVTARRYILTGLVFCARCDVKMVAHSRRYECSTNLGGCNGCGISGARLEADIIAAVRSLAETPKVRKHLAARANEGAETDLLDEIATTEAEVKLLATDYAAGLLGRDGYIAAVSALEQRIDQARKRLSRHLATVEAVTVTEDGSWDEIGFDRQRAVIGQLIKKITVTPSQRASGVYDFQRVKIDWT